MCRTRVNLLIRFESSTASVVFEDVTLANGKKRFHRKISTEKRATEHLQEKLNSLRTSSEDPDQHRELRAQLRHVVDEIITQGAPMTSPRYKQKGKRFDFLVHVPDEFSQIAVDVATCYSTANSYLRGNFKVMKDIVDATLHSHVTHTSNPDKGQASCQG